MARGRSHVEDALVLRSIDYRDADRIVTLLTRGQGRLSALARGARRSRRRFGGRLEPCCLIRVEIRPGRGDLWHLDRAEVVDPFSPILTSLDRLALAGGVIELTRELSAELAADEEAFDLALRTLVAIAEEPPRAERLLAFWVHLLARHGLAPVLDRCVVTGVAVPEGRAALFDPRRGGVVARAAGGGPIYLSWEARRSLSNALESGEPGSRAWGAQATREALGALRSFSESHVGRRVLEGGLTARMLEREDPGDEGGDRGAEPS